MSNGEAGAASGNPREAPAASGVGESRSAQIAEVLAWTGLRVGILANSAGRGKSGGPDLASMARERLAALGGLVVEVAPDLDVGEQLKALRLERPAPDVIVAAGGDGTINAGAALAIQSGATLVVVPAGTMNLMARDLDMPLEPREVIEAFDRLTIRQIDSAAANEHAFLHSSLMGLVPAMAVLREAFRKQRGFAARWRTAVAMVRTAFGAPKLRLRLETPGGSRVMSTRSLAVACNLLAGETLGSHRRVALDAGVLGVYVSTHRGRLAPLRIIATLATGRLPQDPQTLTLQCRSLRVDSRRRFVRLSNDGEVIWASTPILFRVLPRSLRVAVPMTKPAVVATPDAISETTASAVAAEASGTGGPVEAPIAVIVPAPGAAT